MHDEDVFAAFAVGEEGDPLAVGRKFGLAVEGHAAVDQFGLATFDRKRVDVADQFEGNRLAVRGNIQRKPGAFIGSELDFVIRLERQPFFLVFLLFFLFFLFVFLLSRYGAAESEAQHHTEKDKPRGQAAPTALHHAHAFLLRNNDEPLKIVQTRSLRAARSVHTLSPRLDAGFGKGSRDA